MDAIHLYCKFVPKQMHRQHKAERAIIMLKNNFISALADREHNFWKVNEVIEKL